MKKGLGKIFNRLFVVALGIILQIIWVVSAMYILNSFYEFINVVFLILSVIMVFRMLIKWENNPSYVLAWSVPMLVFPIFGLTIYLIFGRAGLTRSKRKEFEKIHNHYIQFIQPDALVDREILTKDLDVARQSHYITQWAGYPAWKNTSSKYYPSGEEMFVDMIEELKKAEHFIFMEFFIINKGEMWDTILEILEEKAKAGVDVRVVYDDFGCINYLPPRYYKTLQSKGIKCAAFNPFRPMMSVIMNNRSHRKILDIDGHTAFTGGINLADEYINKIVRFGYWKDTGVMLKGDAVWSFTLMFLEMWNYVTGIETSPKELQKMKPGYYAEKLPESDGYIQPYADFPLGKERIGENIYRNIIARADKYVYIYTPYLIIGSEMLTTLCLAAKSGVDIRIITPEIPDKPTTYLLTQSYYTALIKAGVKIYQFTPGFIHAKCFVCDDEIATVGSINLDYRSLNMHFECGTWMYKSQSVMQVRQDFIDTMAKSHEISLEFCEGRPLLTRAFQAFLRLFAPLF